MIIEEKYCCKEFRVDTKLKTALLILYQRALYRKDEVAKMKIKELANNLLNNVDDFILNAESDFRHLRNERPEIILFIEHLSEIEYNYMYQYLSNNISN